MMPHESDELHPSQEIIRHKPREKPFEPAFGVEGEMEAITKHIERHVGKIDNVWHELVSDLVHVDIHRIPPTPQRNFHTLVTTGMSDRRMAAPEGAEGYGYAELMLCLPKNWPLSKEAFKDESNYWPIRWLTMLARLPHEYDTWFGFGHSVPNGDPPEPFAPNTGFCCMLLSAPATVPEEFVRLIISSEKSVHFYSVVPLYREEVDFKLKHGTDDLLARFEKEGVTEIVDIGRKNVCKKRFGFW